MTALFIDSSTDYFHVAVIKNGTVLHAERIKADKNMTEFAVAKVAEVMRLCQILPAHLDDIYVTTGPGSFTSVRIGLTIAKTIISYHRQINLHHATSLIFQLGPGDGISKINARSSSQYVAWRMDGKLHEPEGTVSDEQVEKLIAEHPQLPVFSDMSDQNILKNLCERIAVFKRADDYKLVSATYIKPAYKA